MSTDIPNDVPITRPVLAHMLGATSRKEGYEGAHEECAAIYRAGFQPAPDPEGSRAAGQPWWWIRYSEAHQEMAKMDRALRDSVPDRYKRAWSPVGAVQNYIAELENRLRAHGERPLDPPAGTEPHPLDTTH